MFVDYGEVQSRRAAQETSDRLAFADAVQSAKAEMVRDYMRAAMHLPMDTPLNWAPSVPNYDAPRVKETGNYLRRQPTLEEVLIESLDHDNGPSQADLFGLIAAAARGEPVKEKAAALIARMADAWVEWNDEAIAETLQ